MPAIEPGRGAGGRFGGSFPSFKSSASWGGRNFRPRGGGPGPVAPRRRERPPGRLADPVGRGAGRSEGSGVGAGEQLSGALRSHSDPFRGFPGTGAGGEHGEVDELPPERPSVAAAADRDRLEAERGREPGGLVEQALIEALRPGAGGGSNVRLMFHSPVLTGSFLSINRNWLRFGGDKQGELGSREGASGAGCPRGGGAQPRYPAPQFPKRRGASFLGSHKITKVTKGPERRAGARRPSQRSRSTPSADEERSALVTLAAPW